jgi:putative FmdB family regulatory protein
MPLYEYECKSCKNIFDVALSLKELSNNPKVVCPKCNSEKVLKKLGAFFAKTDRKS